MGVRCQGTGCDREDATTRLMPDDTEKELCPRCLAIAARNLHREIDAWYDREREDETRTIDAMVGGEA